jgi:hypothetical protein
MRGYLWIGVMAVALAACNRTEPTPAPAAQPTAQTPAPATPAPAANPEFPTGFEPPFTYKIRSKKTEPAADGNLRRLVIEFKQGDVATVDKQIETALIAQGYRRYKTLNEGDAVVGDYGNNGKRVTVTTSPSDGKLVLEPDSLGTVYFVWKE